ncbi:MAG TPA: OmpA family protein [Thermoanaerobaculaceae bacterium]|jgi:peptidoglycan-associated lipoprotein|nr:OmpA family protein [Thermoanaerobaculaceae bacterium]
MRKSLLVVLAVGLVVTLGVTGCATKTYVQEQVAAASKVQDTKIGEVQKQVEATQMDVTNLKKSDAMQNDQLAKLSDTAKDALNRANEANKLANHSFLYEVTLTDDAVHFGFNRSDLSADAKAALDAFAKRVKDENKNVYIEIQGHTDGVGSDEYNVTLGQARAEAVMRYLVMQQGFPMHRLSAVSYGKFKPIADNKTAEGRAKNRRVTLVVMF